jgi:hypothetical protein
MVHHSFTTLGRFDGTVTGGSPNDCGYQSQNSPKSANPIKRQSHYRDNRSDRGDRSGALTPLRVIAYQGSRIWHPLDEVIRLIATSDHGELR